MEPWISWALALGVGVAGYSYYSRPKKQSGSRVQGKENKVKDDTQRRQDNREDESQRVKKRKQAKPQPAAQTTATEKPAAASQDSDHEDADQQWAQQLQAAKQGVSMTAAKAVSAVNGAQSNKQPKTGDIEGASTGRVPASKDVSDMLEPAAAGPTSIRITGEQKQKKPVAKKEEPATETKKQRQNRKKNEDRKALREDDERERKLLEENQRRTAREARGEPAKNGLGVAQAPANNAWAMKPTSNADAAASTTTQPTALLDTFEQDARSTSSNELASSARSPGTAASLSSQTLPSEEEQMEALREMNGNAGWNQVTTKKGKKKVSAPASPPVEPGVREVTDSNVTQAAELTNGAARSAASLPKKAATSTNAYSALDQSTPKAKGMKAHPDDSDWAVE